MSLAVVDTPNIAVTQTGLEVRDDISFEEWASLAPVLGDAARGVAFVIGDWLLYGDQRFGDGAEIGSEEPLVRSDDYDVAIQQTGLDRSTLQAYAHVARKVPRSLRNKDLSWEHHKVVAKLPPSDQSRWLEVANENRDRGRPVSTRRLRRSIQAGRLLSIDEVEPPESDRGIDNHIPFVNRLVAWWAKMRERGWLDDATPQQRAALKRDLKPVVSIYEEL